MSVRRKYSRSDEGFLLKYSQLEEASSIDAIRHPIIREALRLVDIRARNLEITSMADISAGTGLGSSGSFATALLTALHTYKKNVVHPHQLAEQACRIEIDILEEPIGRIGEISRTATCGAGNPTAGTSHKEEHF